MTIHKKSVAEIIGAKEKTLRGSKVYSDGEEITIITLSSIWSTESSVSTTWENSKTIPEND